jgi:hypothetical protein
MILGKIGADYSGGSAESNSLARFDTFGVWITEALQQERAAP